MATELHENTRIAGTRPGFIAPTATAGGDAPPFTYTPSPASHSRMASTGARQHCDPHSFTENNRTSVALVAAMVAVVLTMTGIALLVLLDASSHRTMVLVGCTGGFVIFGAALIGPALLQGDRPHRRSERSDGPDEIVVLGLLDSAASEFDR